MCGKYPTVKYSRICVFRVADTKNISVSINSLKISQTWPAMRSNDRFYFVPCQWQVLEGKSLHPGTWELFPWCRCVNLIVQSWHREISSEVCPLILWEEIHFRGAYFLVLWDFPLKPYKREFVMDMTHSVILYSGVYVYVMYASIAFVVVLFVLTRAGVCTCGRCG